jgi:hypothetical protein
MQRQRQAAGSTNWSVFCGNLHLLRWCRIIAFFDHCSLYLNPLVSKHCAGQTLHLVVCKDIRGGRIAAEVEADIQEQVQKQGNTNTQVIVAEELDFSIRFRKIDVM